jgi:hypothetical protein
MKALEHFPAKCFRGSPQKMRPNKESRAHSDSIEAECALAPEARCRDCAHFRNDPAYLEDAVPGLNTLSSAWASVRGDDGLCLRHERFCSAGSGCAAFSRRSVEGR